MLKEGSRHETELNQLLHEWSQVGYKVTGSVFNVSVRAQREKLMEETSSVFNGKLNILKLKKKETPIKLLLHNLDESGHQDNPCTKKLLKLECKDRTSSAHSTNDSDSFKKFPSKSCPLKYGTAKIQEDALKLFNSGLREFLGSYRAETSGNQNNKWGVTSLSVTAGAGSFLGLRSTCSRVDFPGYQAVYKVKKLEELGIGMPSTYASTIKVLKVSAFLAHHFFEVTNYSFTADMETEVKW
ncbi:hypothetical protein IFM89_005380 [Coptis chinensis]|uniref:Uncharacterized protein n=1 Tax=Coptis chinensis TaxID=261450 RepID=A0A835IRJ2_9MAGN|nr:hypothetical protein IFM89_005380 [Coptis chinensis]